MQEQKYRGCNIIADAFLSKKEKWVPRAQLVSEEESMNVEESPLVWDNQEFPSQREAEDFAIYSAKFYIDNNY